MVTQNAVLWQIRFAPFRTMLRLPEYSDRAVEVARKRLERLKLHALPLNPKTGFPFFTVYRNGQKVAGG